MVKSKRILGKHFLAVAERIADNRTKTIDRHGFDNFDDYSCCNFSELGFHGERIKYQNILRNHEIDTQGSFDMNPSDGYTPAERNEQRIMFLCLLAAQANYRSKK
jgi:hypothetical protein